MLKPPNQEFNNPGSCLYSLIGTHNVFSPYMKKLKIPESYCYLPHVNMIRFLSKNLVYPQQFFPNVQNLFFLDIDKLQKEFKNKRLSGKNLTVDVVPVSKCIIVSNIKPGTKEEAVMFYFDNHRKSGVEGVERVEMDDRNHTCIVYFVDTEGMCVYCYSVVCYS